MDQSTERPEASLYRTGARFNAIYVLESLAPGELRTGRDLYESVLKPATHQLRNLHVEFFSVSTKEQLLSRLARITHAAQVANHHPIIHVEAHGGLEGILLADGTRIDWRGLVAAFTDINVACKNNLIVVAMSCYGWNLTASLLPSDRAPVFMLVGPPEPMKARELLEATRSFYGALLTKFDVNAALRAMNASLPFSQWPIRPATAEILYCRVFREYIESHGSVDALRTREGELVAHITRTRSLNVSQSAELRMQLRRDLMDHRAAYDRHRERFLMLDLHPEDATRFGLTYELCCRPQGDPSP